MTEAKHTEGPWQSVSIDHDPYTIIGGIDDTDDGRMHFTEVCTVNETAAGAASNAMLIAAAPDLLEVLRRIEPHLDAIACYASTASEHEPNQIAVDARALLFKLDGTMTEPTSTASATIK